MNVDNPKINQLSLCTGYGGIYLGLAAVIGNLQPIAYVEIEAFAIENLVAKIEKGWLPAAPIWTDLKTFDGKPFYGMVDLLTGGFPCQPFSTAGNRKGETDPRHLFPSIERIIDEARPKMCFFENVAGIISTKMQDGKSALRYVLERLEERGYSCAWGMYSAREFGLPHNRKRVFILAHAPCIQHKSGERKNYNEKRCSVNEKKIRKRNWNKFAEFCQIISNDNSEGLQRNTKKNDTKRRKVENGQPSECYQEYPGRPGWKKYWEPPYEVESKMGRSIHGLADRMGTADGIKTTVDSFHDEIAMLGNGVVPIVAGYAFLDLLRKVKNEH